MQNTTPSNAGEDVFKETAPAKVGSGSGARIHFPSSLDAPAARLPRQYTDYLQTPYGMNYAPPPRRSSPLNPQKGNQRRSVQANTNPLMESPTLRQRRIPSPGNMDMGGAYPEDEADVSLYSNEYDLSQEDPRILVEVQRALRLKAKREARLRRQQSPHLSPSKEGPSISTGSRPSPSHSPWSAHGLSVPSTHQSTTPPRKTSNSTASDIDFSPSTGLQLPVYAHPVPTSLDNGSTLDWTGTSHDDEKERKWHLIGKKKEKDRILPLGVIAEQQETLYKEKLSKLRASASQQTHRKAAITTQQLGRRYALLEESHSSRHSGAEGFNFLNAARWYASVNDATKRSIEKTEPFSWLRHLESPGGKTTRSPWHMTALIMEKHVEAMKAIAVPNIPQGGLSAETIPDGTTLAISSEKDDHEPLSPMHETLSFGAHHRTHDSLDGRIRGTLDSSSSFRFPDPGAGAGSSTLKSTRDFPRPYLQSNARSDISSVAGSTSDFSDTGAGKKPLPSVSQNASPRRPEIEIEVRVPGEHAAIPVDTKISSSSKDSAPSIQSKSPLSQSVGPSTRKQPLPRRIWHSTPTTATLRQTAEFNEVRLKREYDVKLRILEESSKQNHRIRQALNRISAAVREYETVQQMGSKKPGVHHRPLPKELVDAFSHDPAAVTGSTRRLGGWRAVEDIHTRVLKQRAVLRAFLSNCPEHPAAAESILSGPAQKLMGTLEALELHRSTITARAAEISRSLKEVQQIHADVTLEYNKTVSKTSVIYPELSHIVALEESYRDRYQRFYDFGMDALTLLLDTVTPLWRTYGKTIGEDVRDFLIIPLYRNEFTGEIKRYPITGLPTRSLRHWLGLILFFFASMAVNFLQFRTAIASIHHSTLQWLPYNSVRWTALPLFWIAIFIQWVAVIVESLIVLMQMGTIAWWIGWFIKIFH